MEIKGQLYDFRINLFEDKHQLVLQVEDAPNIINNYEILRGKDLRIKITEYREKRSKNANAMFHVMVGRIAMATGASNIRVKNNLVAAHGQMMFHEGRLVTIESNLEPEIMMEWETPHTLLDHIKYDANNNPVYVYRVYRPTRGYNTKEMAHLIECTMEEAREYGIETFSDREIERVMAEWNPEA